MNKAFTLLEMLIAITISALVVVGTYNLFSTVVNARFATSDSSAYAFINTSLSLLVNRDFNNFVLDRGENTTISGDENSKEDESEPNESAEQFGPDSETEKGGEAYSKNLIIDNTGKFPKVTIKTHNTVFFNKSVPVMVTYYIDNDDFLVRLEENARLEFEEGIRLIGSIKDFKVFSFNGEKYVEGKLDPRLIKLNLKIGKYDYEIITGILDEQKR